MNHSVIDDPHAVTLRLSALLFAFWSVVCANCTMYLQDVQRNLSVMYNTYTNEPTPIPSVVTETINGWGDPLADQETIQKNTTAMLARLIGVLASKELLSDHEVMAIIGNRNYRPSGYGYGLYGVDENHRFREQSRLPRDQVEVIMNSTIELWADGELKIPRNSSVSTLVSEVTGHDLAARQYDWVIRPYIAEW